MNLCSLVLLLAALVELSAASGHDETIALPTNVLRVVELQTALIREGISPGPIDGLFGAQTAAALRAFQQKRALTVTGRMDETTRTNLPPIEPLFVSYTVMSNDIDRLVTIPSTWVGKSLLPALDYEAVLELVAEKHQTHTKLVQRINPALNWTNIAEGAIILVPNAQYPPVSAKAALLRIGLSERTLQAFDAATNLLVHFPCSIAQRVEKRPVGELRVSSIAENPNYTFDPAIFPESPEAQDLGRKLILQPGPNNPVGTVWIGLDRPGYGIHGTPLPEKVGRTESHGCFRLANWNAEYLLKLVSVGTPVVIQP
ncbi:MAG: L,D-transpeptidase [Verrucomicrobia subdivision 3 bacterium]|nr:L,D-transpeptidase [Limisphaerales bacterium]